MDLWIYGSHQNTPLNWLLIPPMLKAAYAK